MSEFDLSALYQDDEPVGYDQYVDIKETAIDLVHTPGTRFLDSSYELEFFARHEMKTDFGPYSHLRNEVQVSLGMRPNHDHEFMIIRMDRFAVKGMERIKLLRRNLMFAVFGAEVKHGHVITVLPSSSKAPPEAQAIWDVPCDVRRDFDAWEYELRRPQKMTRELAQRALAELREFASEY